MCQLPPNQTLKRAAFGRKEPYCGAYYGRKELHERIHDTYHKLMGSSYIQKHQPTLGVKSESRGNSSKFLEKALTFHVW